MFNLSDKIKKVNSFSNDLIIAITIVLVALISFGLGRLSKIRENKTPITIENATFSAIATKSDFVANSIALSSATRGVAEKLYVASKSGIKYHYPWCAGAVNIKEENKIWFSTKEEAKKAGYSPASNCKGL